MALVDLEAGPRQPIFILSCPRSGSSLLRNILDAHPQICGVGDALIGPLSFHLQRTVKAVLEPIMDGDEEARGRSVYDEVRRIAGAIMDTYASHHGAAMWCDHSPQNLVHLDALAATFPTARYLCLYRHCLDVVFSCNEYIRLGHYSGLANEARARSGGRDDLFPALIDIWVERSKRILEFERAHARSCFRVGYEAYVTRPEEVLPRLFGFLGVVWDPRVLRDAFTRGNHDASGDVKVHYTTSVERRIGKGDKVPLAQVAVEHVARMNVVLAELGYAEVDPGAGAQLARHFAVERKSARRIPDLETLFGSHLPAVLRSNSAQLAGLDRSIKIVVTGSNPGAWVVRLAAPHPLVQPDNGEADLVVTLDEDLLLAIFNREVEPVRAWASGRIVVEGDRELAPHTKWFLTG